MLKISKVTMLTTTLKAQQYHLPTSFDAYQWHNYCFKQTDFAGSVERNQLAKHTLNVRGS